MSDTPVRVIRAADIERKEDDEGFMEALRPEVSGAPELFFARFGTYRGSQIPPHTHTCNSIAYLVRGRAAFISGEGLTERHEMVAGDYVVVPKDVVHMEETVGDEPAEFILVRDGGGGETVYLEDHPAG